VEAISRELSAMWKSARMLLLCVVTCLLCPSAAEAQRRGGSAKKPPPIRLPETVRQKKPVQMDVASVDTASRSRVQGTAEMIDSLVARSLTQHDQQPNRRASDPIFLRRIYLDVAGRIPTVEEADAFLRSDQPDKREQLIDDLLGRPDYVFNLYNMWADILRLTERPQPNLIADPYLAYVKDSIRTNKPYDRWVYEMLTAEGKIWDQPAVGFQLRDDGQPLPYVDNTVRVFLGTQIGCAQCHDHPFDVWTQHEFYELAAFTYGVKTRIDRNDPEYKNGNRASMLINEARKKNPNGRVPGELRRLARANSYRVKETTRPLRLPHDYAYSDDKPNAIVKPDVLWGEIPSSAASRSPRHQFAAWLTSPDNPYFSKTIANRYWKRFLGVGLVEPVDDFNEDNACVNEALLDFLSKEIVRLRFDQKEFIRAILYSQTYQRESTPYDVASGVPYYFPGPALRRMTAEQAWDSILTLAVYNPVPFQRPTAEQIREVVDLDMSSVTLTQAEAQAAEFKASYFMGPYKRSLNAHAYKGNVLCRASELPVPLPPDHFLRQFGQGDREVISAAQTDATVPQVLTMFNGPITHVMLENGSLIYDNVTASANPREAVDVIFASLVGRRPSSRDRIEAIREISTAERPGIGYGNLIWALLNTREFLFVQ